MYLQGQSFGRPAWFNATLDGRVLVQGGKWLIPLDLQQWPKTLPSRGSLELDVLQLPLSKVPWIANDGSIVITTKQVVSAAASTPTAAVVLKPTASLAATVTEDDVDGEPGDSITKEISYAAQTTPADCGNDHGGSDTADDQHNDVLAGAASAAVQESASLKQQ